MNDNFITDSPDALLAHIKAGLTVSITAPFCRPERALVGYAFGPDEAHCLNVPLEEFTALARSFYVDVHSPRAFHGLKRIWEYLDEFDLRPADDPHNNLNIRMISDTKLMAFLLDPDAARSSGQGDQSIQEHLTLSYLAHKYLGLEYRLSVPSIYTEDSIASIAGILANDALITFRLADALPSLMTRELLLLYRNLELPLMVVLDDMRRTGIGFDGQKCRNQVAQTQIAMASLAREISGGQSVDLTSDDDVYRFLSAQSISFPVGPAYVKRWGLTRILEEMAHAHHRLVRFLISVTSGVIWDFYADGPSMIAFTPCGDKPDQPLPVIMPDPPLCRISAVT